MNILIKLLIVVMIISTPIFSKSGRDLIAEIQAKYQKSTDFKASFTQLVKYGGLKRQASSSGILMYKKINKVKWMQKSPEKSYYISNGQKMWLYLPDDKQVFVNKDIKGILDRIGLLFLSGKNNMLSSFDISIVNNSKNGVKKNLDSLVSSNNVTFEFKPKKMDGFKKALVGINRKKMLITKVAVVDMADNKTVITLSKIQLNIGIEDSIFNFSPPKGVEVYNPKF